jgi:hypothetical protein
MRASGLSSDGGTVNEQLLRVKTSAHQRTAAIADKPAELNKTENLLASNLRPIIQVKF